VVQREESLDRKSESQEQRERALAQREQEVVKAREEASALAARQQQELERISGLTAEQAREQLARAQQSLVWADRARAARALRSAHIDGVVPARAMLAEGSAPLAVEIEERLLLFRSRVARGSIAHLRRDADTLLARIGAAQMAALGAKPRGFFDGVQLGARLVLVLVVGLSAVLALGAERQEMATRQSARAAGLEREPAQARVRSGEVEQSAGRSRAAVVDLERRLEHAHAGADRARASDEERHQEEMDRVLERIGDLEEALEEEYLQYRIRSIEYLGDGLRQAGVNALAAKPRNLRCRQTDRLTDGTPLYRCLVSKLDAKEPLADIPDSDRVDLALQLVRGGLVLASCDAPRAYADAEDEARGKSLNLWAMMKPAEYRRRCAR
jgi:hypothetical protein